MGVPLFSIEQMIQRARSAGTGSGHHGSRLSSKKIWRTRSKSQSRASPATTSVWSPVGGNMWSSVTGRVVSLDRTSVLNLSELERLTLQQVSLAKLQAMNLGCAIRIPTEQPPTSSQKKRRPHLLKRKALTTGIFDSKKDDSKDSEGQVFGLPLTKCLENERIRTREAAERAAMHQLANEEVIPASRKSSHGGSHASFSSLNERNKQSTTGSLESLNLDRKRPSLQAVGGGVGGVGDSIGFPTPPLTSELLLVEPHPQIPGLVNTCIRYLQANGLHTLGLFRVSSSKKRVKQLREEFDSGSEVWLTDDHCPHDVATLLKEFFRHLPEPLLTKELYEPFIRTQKIRNRKLQFEALQNLIHLMPVPNRDTLFTLLTFLATVAEHSTDRITETGEKLQGNKMDSSNLATLFAPNIFHSIASSGSGDLRGDGSSTAEMAQQAEEVISVVRAMIDHNKDLFEVPAELLDETYQHLMDTHPDALDVLLRRRCTGDELDLEGDTGSSVCEGSECSLSLPRSPTDAHQHHDFDRRRLEEEEKGWFRRREKSMSTEREQHHQQESKGSRWFRRRDKSCDEAARRRSGASVARRTDTREQDGSRRLSSPEIDRDGVITASLRIPVPFSGSSRPAEETDTRGKVLVRSGRSGSDRSGRERSGSSDSYLINAAMSFQPLSKKSDRVSHDSVLSSSSADGCTLSPLSPSSRNTPLSDPSASGASSPLSRTGSPPPWLSPDSGTPGLTPPNSPPANSRRREARTPQNTPANTPASTSTNTQATPVSQSKTPSTPVRKSNPTGHPQTPGAYPLGRSRTAEQIRNESTQQTAIDGVRRGAAARRYTRRRYTGERHPTGQLPDLSGAGDSRGNAGEGHSQPPLWKRWEIIASDPTEPETFV